jgi:hypothetical protein
MNISEFWQPYSFKYNISTTFISNYCLSFCKTSLFAKVYIWISLSFLFLDNCPIFLNGLFNCYQWKTLISEAEETFYSYNGVNSDSDYVQL